MKRIRWVALVAVSCALCVFLPGLARGQPALLLDGNLKAGYQGLDVLIDVQAGQRVALEVYGKGIEGVSGFSAQITYDSAHLSFDGFDAGDVIPGFTGLTIDGESGAIEIGGASVSGVSSVSEGRLGVIYFKSADGSPIGVSLLDGKIASGGAASAADGRSTVVIGGGATTPMTPDADLSPGLQAASKIVDVAVGDVIAFEIYGTTIDGASGYSAVLEYDSAQLAFVDFSSSDHIPGLTGLTTESGGSVEIGGASVTGASPSARGLLGVVRFVVQSGFSGETTISMPSGRVFFGGEDVLRFTNTQLRVLVTGVGGGSVVKTPDLDGSGKVDFPDFLIFAGGFGKAQGQAGFDARLDFDNSGKIDFPDFLQFAQSFGKSVG